MPSRWIERGVGKRSLDVVVSGAALVILAPVAACVAVAVRVRLGSPVLFRQLRAGRHGQPMTVSKFRSMSDERHPDGTPLSDEARLSGFGHKLRATSLDELPQLISVLAGEMSLVGPRPLPEAYVERYDARQRRRLDALPGITGWAQVHGRNALDWPERFELDVWYVEHATLWTDIKVLLRTVTSVLSRRGVSSDGHVTMTEFTGSR